MYTSETCDVKVDPLSYSVKVLIANNDSWEESVTATVIPL